MTGGGSTSSRPINLWKGQMKFFNTAIGFFSVIVSCVVASAEMIPYTRQRDVKLQRLPPSQVLTKLDLDRPGLEAVKAAVAKGDQPRALADCKK
jgi:hypothetical protein